MLGISNFSGDSYKRVFKAGIILNLNVTGGDFKMVDLLDNKRTGSKRGWLTDVEKYLKETGFKCDTFKVEYDDKGRNDPNEIIRLKCENVIAEISPFLTALEFFKKYPKELDKKYRDQWATSITKEFLVEKSNLRNLGNWVFSGWGETNAKNKTGFWLICKKEKRTGGTPQQVINEIVAIEKTLNIRFDRIKRCN